MLVLLSVPWWADLGWWGIVLAIVGVVITLWIYLKQRTRKHIAYQVLSDAPIINIDKRVEDKVKIIDKDSNEELNHANLVSLKVWNSGDVDLIVWNAEDADVENLEEPITFKFEGRTVVSLTELETDPQNDVIKSKERERYLKKPTPESDQVGLPRCLLKPHESITLSVLVNGPKGKITPKGKLFQGQIVDIDTIRQNTARRVRIFGVALVLLLLSSVGINIYLNLKTPRVIQNLKTPRVINTSASTLVVAFNLVEDQDATDRMSNITMQLGTDVIEGVNHLNFLHGESVTCNGVSIKLNDSQQYKFKVSQGGEYVCSYVGFKPGKGLQPAVPMIDVATRSRLLPYAPSFSNQSFTIRYTPDSSRRACPITAVASDSSGSTINGGTSSSAEGVYNGPNISTLTGTGEIVLKRTCSWIIQDAFFSMVNLTYQSTASVNVVWG